LLLSLFHAGQLRLREETSSGARRLLCAERYDLIEVVHTQATDHAP
jgi:hypothetical protein